MTYKNIISKVLSIFLYSVIISSLVWIFLSILVIVHADFASKNKPMSISTLLVNDIALPRIDSDLQMQEIASRLLRLPKILSSVGEYTDDYKNGDIINVSMSLNPIDSTYYYRLVYIKDCECPAKLKNRFEIGIEYIHPSSLNVFKEYRSFDLSAEDVQKFNELLALERR